MGNANGAAGKVEVTEMDTLPMESPRFSTGTQRVPGYAQRDYQAPSEQAYPSVVGSWIHVIGAAGGKVSLVKIAPDGTASMFVDWVSA